MSYDYIIQNPPYSGSFHLSFLEKGLELIKSNNGKMTIIEPATWLINVRKNGKAKLYDEIKSKLEGHVSKIVIENMNIEFGTSQYTPFAITYIDMSKTFDDIEFVCFGETKILNNLYDCNLIGEYSIIWSIINKVQAYKDMMRNHIYNGKKEENAWYAKYDQLLGKVVCCDPRDIDTWYRNGYFASTYIWSIFDDKPPIDIDSVPLKNLKNGYSYRAPKYGDGDGNNITGTKQELENWKHFVFNNKLPLFINIVMTIDQHNNSLDYVPWLVDKQYTDEEINKLFNFSNEEIELIDKTLKKFERHSPWFKRYMCGKDAVSNEEVQKFIDSL